MLEEKHIEAQRAERRRQGEAALREGDVNFQLLADSIPQLAWMAQPDGWIFWYNKRWYDYTGATPEDMEGWGWRKVHHPDHVERVVTGIQHSWETGEPWEDTFPLRSKDGTWRWFLSRAMPVRDESGEVLRWFGTNTDITERLKGEQRQRNLLDELNHRVKNTLAAVQSLARQSARGPCDVESFMEKFDGRLLSLSRVHGLLARDAWQGADLMAIVREALKPVVLPDQFGERVSLSGPEIRLGPTAAVSFGMALHELAINAMTYGALSNGRGTVDVAWDLDLEGGEKPALEFVWKESGGPDGREAGLAGFGTRLIQEGLARELDGSVTLEVGDDGAVCAMRLPLSKKVMIG